MTGDDDVLPPVNFSGEQPTMWIPGRFQKNGRGKHCAIVPEFYDFLQETPEDQRTGF
ncbi:MAG: hypothetical protein IID45_08510 [Planctomycetes bacterium]|nr:hypothetical protein [Planctomycetota bacterium]